MEPVLFAHYCHSDVFGFRVRVDITFWTPNWSSVSFVSINTTTKHMNPTSTTRTRMRPTSQLPTHYAIQWLVRLLSKDTGSIRDRLRNIINTLNSLMHSNITSVDTKIRTAKLCITHWNFLEFNLL